MTFSEKEILNFIGEALEIGKKKISINSSAKNIENWDSLGQLNILTKLDKKLSGKAFLIKKLVKANSAKQIINILKSHKLIK
jgi:acyl carrier protein